MKKTISAFLAIIILLLSVLPSTVAASGTPAMIASACSGGTEGDRKACGELSLIQTPCYLTYMRIVVFWRSDAGVSDLDAACDSGTFGADSGAGPLFYGNNRNVKEYLAPFGAATAEYRACAVDLCGTGVFGLGALCFLEFTFDREMTAGETFEYFAVIAEAEGENVEADFSKIPVSSSMTFEEDPYSGLYDTPTLFAAPETAVIAEDAETLRVDVRVGANPGFGGGMFVLIYPDTFHLLSGSGGDLGSVMYSAGEYDVPVDPDSDILRYRLLSCPGTPTEGYCFTAAYFESHDVYGVCSKNGVLVSYTFEVPDAASRGDTADFYVVCDRECDFIRVEDGENGKEIVSLAFGVAGATVTFAGSCAHENTREEYIAPDCENYGSRTLICEDCGDILGSMVLPALGHSFENNICTVCGAAEPPREGTCGDGLYWSYYESNGRLLICGTGEMPDWDDPYGVPWASFRDNIVSVEIDKGVSRFGANAFCGCTALRTVSYSGTLDGWCEIEFPYGSFDTVGYSNPLTFAHDFFVCGERLDTVTVSADAGISENTFGRYVLSSIIFPHDVNGTGHLNCSGDIYYCGDAAEFTVSCTCVACRGRRVLSYCDTFGHDLAVTEDTAPTCSAVGKKTEVCTVCEAVFETVYPMHSATAAREEIPAICIAEGMYIEYCSICGFTLDAGVIPFSDHSTVTDETPATCTSDGYRTVTCTVCGEVLEDVVLPAGHRYETEIIARSCTSGGVMTGACVLCGEPLPPTPLPPLGHDYAPEKTAPTCTESGFTTYTCLRCGDTYEDDFLPPAGHTAEREEIPRTCTEFGLYFEQCTVCGELLSSGIIPAGHSYVTETVEPTLTEDGFDLHTCTDCGDSYTDNVVPHASFIPGDIDGDGKIGAKDMNLLKSIVLGYMDSVPAAELNGDGKVNATDVNILKSMIMSGG